MPDRLKIFVSSPGDVTEERALTERVLRRIAESWRNEVQLVLYLWEHEPLLAHADFQTQIEPPSQCDLVICILWSRLGTRLPPAFAGAADRPGQTGTEFEVRDALQARLMHGRPDLLIYRRTATPRVALNRGDVRECLAQFEALEAFCREILANGNGQALAHHTYAEPWEFERRLTAHVRSWFEQRLGSGRVPPRWQSGSPYRGLQAFDDAHKDVYFGRSQAVSEVLNRIRERESAASPVRFLLIQGMSGMGKSSLLHAGVLSLLEGRAIDGVGLWLHAGLKPSETMPSPAKTGVFGVLATCLATCLPSLSADTEALAQRLADAPEEAVARLDGHIGQRATAAGISIDALRLVLWVDPLEECWTTLSEDDRLRLARCLNALAREGRVWVMAAIRSDFVSNLEEAPEFLPLMGSCATFTLLPPQPDELADMIREPAFAAGLQWERENGLALDQVILREACASPEALPLLEFALEQIHERRRGALLTFDAWRLIGGLPGSIADSAESCLAENAVDAAALRRVLRLLIRVDPGGVATRRRARPEEFQRHASDADLLAALSKRRLCVFDGAPGANRVSLAHEALISAWPRLREWLAVEATLLQVRDALDIQAEEWRRSGRPASLLALAPEKVAQARRLASEGVELGEGTAEYVRVSLQRATSVRRLRAGTLVGVILLSAGAITAAAIAWSQRDDALHARAQAQGRESARAMAAGDRTSALRLVSEAEAVWHDRKGRPDAEVAFERSRAELVREVQVAVDGFGPLINWPMSSRSPRQTQLLFLSTREGDLITIDPASGRGTLLQNHGTAIARADVAGSGRVAVLDSEGTLSRYETGTGKRLEVRQHAVPFPFAIGASQCDGGVCDAMAWNADNRHCEYVHIDLAAVAWAPELHVVSPTPTCRWSALQLLAPGRFLAIDDAKNAYLAAVEPDGRVSMSLLLSDVSMARVIDETTVLFQRSSTLEQMDLRTRKIVIQARDAASVASLNLSVPGGLVGAPSSDGTITVLRDGHAYSVGRSGQVSLRVFELANTRAILDVGASGMVRVMDYRTGRELYRWQAASDPLRGAFFDARTGRLAVLSTVGSIRIWDVSRLQAQDLSVLPGRLDQAGAAHSTSGVHTSIALDAFTPSDGLAGLGAALFAKPSADLSVLGGASSPGVVLRNGRAYRMRGFQPVLSAESDGGGSWLLSDGQRIVRFHVAGQRVGEGGQVEVLWQGNAGERVQLLVPLQGGGTAVLLPTTIVLLDDEGSERARISRATLDDGFSARLVRARLSGDELLLQTAECIQRSVHVPTSRVLYEVDRVCGGEKP